MTLMLGKKPAVPDPRDFKLRNYMRPYQFPPRPQQFGHEHLIDEWGMLGNDMVGNCVFAGAAHEQMIWSAEGGKQIEFTTQSVISDYSAVTGYDPNDPTTDRGTYVREALKYRRNVGMTGADGQRYKIDAFVSLEPGNVDELLNALYLFGAVGIGIRLTEKAMKQFEKGKAWGITCTPGQTLGGHYVPVVAKRRRLYCVTWGRLQPMTRSFYRKYCDEAWCILSFDMFGEDGRTMEGFDIAQLKLDLTALGE